MSHPFSASCLFGGGGTLISDLGTPFPSGGQSQAPKRSPLTAQVGALLKEPSSIRLEVGGVPIAPKTVSAILEVALPLACKFMVLDDLPVLLETKTHEWSNR